MREKHFRGIWSQKLHSKLRILRNFEMLMWTRKLTFCLEIFFSKVSKKFLNRPITLIFSLRHVFILVLDSCKIWRAYEKNSRKYFCAKVTLNYLIYRESWKNTILGTSGKLWLKMRRMSIIWHVLHICVSSLRLKHRMSLIQRALDSPGLVDYFSYPHHGFK